MVLDERPSRQSRRPGESHSGKRVIAVVSGIVTLVLVVSVGLIAKDYINRKPPAAHPVSVPLQARAAAKPFTPPSSWRLSFNPSFQGSTLDSQVWGTCYPWTTGGCTNYGNPSDPEKEWYQASQDRVANGTLQLVAQREPTSGLNQKGEPQQYACRSGMATTYPGFRYQYGYMEITAKIPFSKGLWPALWLAATNQQWPPEVDILEHWGAGTPGKIYLHPLTGPRQGGPVTMPNLSSGWHTFGLYWTKTQLTWYYDGVQVYSTKTGVPQQSMYLIANLADDDATPGGCTGSLLIKSVKVWEPPS